MREREVFLEGKNNHNRVILKQYDLNMHSFAYFLLSRMVSYVREAPSNTPQEMTHASVP